MLNITLGLVSTMIANILLGASLAKLEKTKENVTNNEEASI